MQIGELYQFILVLCLVGLLGGVSVLVLDKFQATSGVTAAAQTSINGSRDAIGAIGSTWMSLIVTIGVLALVVGLVLSSFAYMRSKR